MTTNWRISSFNGALLAAYFVPTWAIVAFRIVASPAHGMFDQPNIAMTLFVSDHLQWAALTTLRFGWLLAVGRLTVVAFFALFLLLLTRPAIRRAGGCNEALAMIMASQVGETAALRLHAAELLAMLGTAIVLLVEQPADAPALLVETERPVSPAVA